MNLRNRIRRDDRGVSMITAMLVGLVLTSLALAALDGSLLELRRSSDAAVRSAAFQAAEAGVDDYLAKLTEDHHYYAHHVHPGESTRQDPAGSRRSAGQTWTAEPVWTYPEGRDAWRAVDNGYEFNLQITPPSAGSVALRIVATGRQVGVTEGLRSIEVLVRAASVADFQMIANADVGYSSNATTRGKLYAGIDEDGVRHDISHHGTAYADLYAEGSITQQPTYQDGAQGYTSGTIRTVVKNPINFNNFTVALVEIKQAAQDSGGIYLDGNVDGWRLTFNSTGTVTIASCAKSNHGNLAKFSPSCTTTTTAPIPAIGAIYAEQSVVVSGVVKGQVTVASNADIVIGGDISYLRPGTDVLGLIARNEMIVARYVPVNLTWTGATMALTGEWRSWNNTQTNGTMTFTGSTAANMGAHMSMFGTRDYNYDLNLLYLQPPFFPVLEESYTILFFRELPI